MFNNYMQLAFGGYLAALNIRHMIMTNTLTTQALAVSIQPVLLSIGALLKAEIPMNLVLKVADAVVEVVNGFYHPQAAAPLLSAANAKKR